MKQDTLDAIIEDLRIQARLYIREGTSEFRPKEFLEYADRIEHIINVISKHIKDIEFDISKMS